MTFSGTVHIELGDVEYEITGDCYFGTTSGNGPDPDDIDNIAVTNPEGWQEIDFDVFVVDLAGELGKKPDRVREDIENELLSDAGEKRNEHAADMGW